MNRLPVEWLAAPDEDGELEYSEMVFHLRAPWFSVDADQLILPITVESKTDVRVESPYPAILKQYGGEGLLNDMLLADRDLDEGTTWQLKRWDNRLEIEPHSD